MPPDLQEAGDLLGHLPARPMVTAGRRAGHPDLKVLRRDAAGTHAAAEHRLQPLRTDLAVEGAAPVVRGDRGLQQERLADSVRPARSSRNLTLA